MSRTAQTSAVRVETSQSKHNDNIGGGMGRLPNEATRKRMAELVDRGHRPGAGRLRSLSCHYQPSTCTVKSVTPDILDTQAIAPAAEHVVRAEIMHLELCWYLHCASRDAGCVENHPA
jgi:hypothetical protein